MVVRKSTQLLKHLVERDAQGTATVIVISHSDLEGGTGRRCIELIPMFNFRWDETPASQRHGGGGGATPLGGGATPSFSTPSMGGMGGATPSFGAATPAGALAMGLATPTPMAAGAMTPEQMQSWRWERELDERNRPLSDEELDALFPQDGYKVSSLQ